MLDAAEAGGTWDGDAEDMANAEAARAAYCAAYYALMPTMHRGSMAGAEPDDE